MRLGVGDGLGGGGSALGVGCGIVGVGDGLPGCVGDGCGAATRVRVGAGAAPGSGAAGSSGRAAGRTVLCGPGRTRAGGDGFMPVGRRDGAGGAATSAAGTAVAALTLAPAARSSLTRRQT